MMRNLLVLAAVGVLAGPARAATADGGYYCGQAILYPYQPVYSPAQDCIHGQAYSYFMPKMPLSAPLPKTEAECVWAPLDEKGVFYHWKPRADGLCYAADHASGCAENMSQPFPRHECPWARSPTP